MKPRPPRRARAPWTLRRRLVLAVVGLLALVSLSIGVVSVALLRASLLDGLDQRLGAVADRSRSVLEGHRDQDDRGGVAFIPTAEMILNGPAQPPGTLALVFDGASISSGYTTVTGSIAELSTHQKEILARQMQPSRAVGIDLGGDVGDYRIMANVSRNGVLYLVGLPLDEVNGTAAQLAIIIGVVSLVGIVFVAVLALWIVRLALRPLQRVTETATRVAELPLDRGEVSLVDRVLAGSGRHSTGCSTTSTSPWRPGTPASARCASSSRMPATSCARRSPRSAATPSSPAAPARNFHPMPCTPSAGSNRSRSG
jgi:two-component system OmpR family sensor kinase